MAANSLDPGPPGLDVALMITRRCNMTCGHCSVESSPGIRTEPSDADLLDWVRAAAASGVRSIRVTGGEPMLRPAVVLRLLRECRRLGLGATMTTNGFWGRTSASALRQLRALQRAGLGSLALSYDRYHAEFQGPAPMGHISRAAEALGMPVRIALVRGTDEAELSSLVTTLDAAAATRTRVYDLQPVGRARELPAALHRAEVEGFCTACTSPAIADDGRVMACNGPAYFEAEGSPLVLGSLRQTSFAELLDRHRDDPILDTIRTKGPAGLRDELTRTPGFERFPFRPAYSGICDLCHHITRSPEAVAALRERLGLPEARAVRLAMWRVIDGHRRRGELSTAYVNGVGASRLFLDGAWHRSASPGHDAERAFGRADFDWRRSIDYLGGCGLARPLLPFLDDPVLTRWAPQFFREGLRARAVQDGLRALVQQEAIHRVAAVVGDLGGRAVLLKGGAFLMRGEPAGTPRATADVDVLVDPAIAGRVRARLLMCGFDGDAAAAPSAWQHLAPVSYQGVPVEIHTRLMAPTWSLPEAEMLTTVRGVPGSTVLATLGPEAMLYHAATHASAGFFSFGLKTAWDIRTILGTCPDFDWDRLAGWASRCGAPRGFWTPLRVLAEELDLPVPAAFLRHAPRDRGARRVATVARHRLFSATESLFDLDAVTKAGLMLLLQDRWAGRVRYVGSKLTWRGRQPGTWSAAVGRARRADIFRQAWRQFRRYRRAVARQRDPVPHSE